MARVAVMRNALAAAAALAALQIGSACTRLTDNVQDQLVPLSYTGGGKVAVLTHDQRPSVLAGQRVASQTGVMRTGLGVPYTVVTASGQDLAWEVSQCISRSLGQRGFLAMPIKAAPTERTTALLPRLAAASADRSLLLTIREWNTDTETTTWYRYDLALRVYDRGGNVLADAAVEGRDHIEAVGGGRQLLARIGVLYVQTLDRLLDDPRVVSAFGPAAAPIAPAPVRPSGENTAEACRDGADNDGDGRPDCADQDCALFVFCTSTETW
jgi:hypothetical protein